MVDGAQDPMHRAPRCGSRTRAGSPCRAPAVRNRKRCRLHGGRSTGPRTAEGLERLRAARTKHGARARDMQELLRRARRLDAAGYYRVDAADRVHPQPDYP